MGWAVLACTAAFLTLFITPAVHTEQGLVIDVDSVDSMATTFGTQLWESLSVATSRENIQQGYDSHVDLSVDEIDGFSMVREMAEEVGTMMGQKVDAIKRIMEVAENKALDHKFDGHRGERLRQGTYTYYNAKKVNVLNENDTSGVDDYDIYLSQYRDQSDPHYSPGYSRMVLVPDNHLQGTLVNTSYSAVYVPSDVEDADPTVINAIDWSRRLDDTFIDNYARDATLSWQYFGSTTGFLRQFPALKWPRMDRQDIYDPRMQDWYTKAAASPKDIVILLDRSAPMTGLKKDLARHVVLTILETLNEDDFVTVLAFSNNTSPVVEQLVDDYGDHTLMQATPGNILQLSDGVARVNNSGNQNISDSLTQAFSTLERYRTKKLGSYANQAIMLVTDNVPEKYVTIFREYNSPHKPVRIFTYLTATSQEDMAPAIWMGCENKGYFSKVSTMSDVKEKVLKYISVMARPMVLHKEHHVRWTGVYADVDVDKGYQFVTSASIPVFNKKPHMNVQVLGIDIEPHSWRKVRVAELLGVVGTDVPIADIKGHTHEYKLGVNGYSFAVNNNGHILFHPNLRPTIDGTLKPNYNSVDLGEVELVDDDTLGSYSRDLPRYNHSVLFQMRKDMIDQEEGMVSMTVRVPMDNMRRVTVREQDYFYHNIPNTSFSLGLTLPSKYGKYRVNGGLNLTEKNSFDATKILSGDNWSVHPDWVYCKFNDNYKKICSQEDSLKHFLELIGAGDNIDWGEKSNVQLLPQCRNYDLDSIWESWDIPKYCKYHKAKRTPYYCDKELVQALALDGAITNIPSSRKEQFEHLGIEFSFVATRSGLTRWEGYKDQDDAENTDIPKKPPVGTKAIEELWYQRAVEYHHHNPHSFLFSVNHPSDTITASHAVYKEMRGHKAPAAVVGALMDYHKLENIFMDSTKLNTQSGDIMSCRNESIGCYVVDNSGFIIISPDKKNVGEFFGLVEGSIMKSLVMNQVFKEVKIFDYQGVCMEEEPVYEESSANMLLTPFKLLSCLFNWILGQIAATIIRLEIHHLWNVDWAFTFASPQDYYSDYAYDDSDDYDENNYGNVEEPTLTQAVFDTECNEENNEAHDKLAKEGYKSTIDSNKMKAKPCDKELLLYELEEKSFYNQKPIKGLLRHCSNINCERPFTVSLIPHTNLVMIVADMTCPCDQDNLSIMPSNVDYDRYGYYGYQMINTNNSYRRRPGKSIVYHPEEVEIRLCGETRSGQGEVAISTILITWSLLYNLVPPTQ